MKNTIVYILIFILAFVGTTAGVYFLNNKYANIFEFDFRDSTTVHNAIVKAASNSDSTAVIESDSLALNDSSAVSEHQIRNKGKELKEHLALTKNELQKAEEELSEKEKQIENLKNKLEEKENSEHDEWLKSTIKLYEAMETNKAGKLLSSLPETEARELLYALKKKKAADILSSLDTETVKRLTRSKQ